MGRLVGLEPMTSGATIQRSNQTELQTPCTYNFIRFRGMFQS